MEQGGKFYELGVIKKFTDSVDQTDETESLHLRILKVSSCDDHSPVGQMQMQLCR